MALFKKQKMLCCICGTEFLSGFNGFNGGTMCGRECFDEYQWRKVLYIMGKDYYPQPSTEKDKETTKNT